MKSTITNLQKLKDHIDHLSGVLCGYFLTIKNPNANIEGIIRDDLKKIYECIDVIEKKDGKLR